MSAKELRAKKEGELQQMLADGLREQFNLRMQRGFGQTPRPHLFKRVRHEIARIKTILNEMKKAKKS